MRPPIRSEWVRRGRGPVVTQMHYGRQGIVTEEMEFGARQEYPPAEDLTKTSNRLGALRGEHTDRMMEAVS